MEEREILQREVLKELLSYSESLIPAVQEIIEELRGIEKEDTKKFLSEVVAGINWEIEVYNQCASLLNEKSNFVDKKAMITAVKNLGACIGEGENSKIAKCLEEDFLPFLNKLALSAKMVV